MVLELHLKVGCVFLNQAVCVKAGPDITLSSVTLSYLYIMFKLILLPCLSVIYLILSEFHSSSN